MEGIHVPPAHPAGRRTYRIARLDIGLRFGCYRHGDLLLAAYCYGLATQRQRRDTIYPMRGMTPIVAVALVAAGCGSAKAVTSTVTRTVTQPAPATQTTNATARVDGYLESHLAPVDYAAVLGERLSGGTVTVSSGQQELAGISLSIATRLYPRAASVPIARRICEAALGAIVHVPVRGVSYVHVTYDQHFSSPAFDGSPDLAYLATDSQTCRTS